MDVAEDGQAWWAGEEGNTAGRAVDFCARDVDNDEKEDDEEGRCVGGGMEGCQDELDCPVDHVGGGG